MVLIDAVKGFLIGAALVIPGLSGSIFAVMLGVYEKILDAVNNLRNDIKGHMKFLLPLAIGAGIGILAFAKVVLLVCEKYPVWSYLFFAGLVIGSLPLVYKKISKIKFNPLYLVISLLCFLSILYMNLLGGSSSDAYIAIESLKTPGDALTMVLAGIFSAAMMTLPGVSGSVMLMVIGHYGTVYNAVSTLLDMAAYILSGNWEMALEAFYTGALVIPFGIGAVAGFLIMAKIMGYLIKKFEALVYYGVFGVILGALAALVHGGVIPGAAVQPINGLTVIVGAACVVVGAVSTAVLSAMENKE